MINMSKAFLGDERRDPTFSIHETCNGAYQIVHRAELDIADAARRKPFRGG